MEWILIAPPTYFLSKTKTNPVVREKVNAFSSSSVLVRIHDPNEMAKSSLFHGSKLGFPGVPLYHHHTITQKVVSQMRPRGEFDILHNVLISFSRLFLYMRASDFGLQSVRHACKAWSIKALLHRSFQKNFSPPLNAILFLSYFFPSAPFPLVYTLSVIHPPPYILPIATTSEA